MEHILNLYNNQHLNNLFQDIYNGNVILFLGAGASVTKEKGFLSKHLIEYYEDKTGKEFNVSNIQTFVDVLESTPGISRSEFDEYVDECLRKLKITDAHRILASMNWREIITTNYDTLIEQAFDFIKDTPMQKLQLKRVRGKRELIYQPSFDEVKYIKLNGCISLKKDFPLVFSTKDFKNANKYYRDVLKELKNPSDKIKFVSIGYSFSDDFAKHLFDIIEDSGYRDKKTMYNVDPYLDDKLLPYFESKKITVIKASFDDFMQKYSEWEKSNSETISKSKKISFTNSKKSKITINHRSLSRLDGALIQLDEYYKAQNISIEDFYKGEEPDFNIINRHFDIIKKGKITSVKEQIDSYKSNSNLVPIVFLTGSFGTGKSTFAYRLIHECTHDESKSVLAFEILDPSKIIIQDLIELFRNSGAEKIILYFNSIEVEFLFKGLKEIRSKLSSEQIKDIDIQIIATIRENILEKNKLDTSIKNSLTLNIDEKLNTEEINELVERLASCDLIKYRDSIEKNLLVNKIKNQYDGDSFISLLEIISGGKHIDNLIDAYNQLSKEAQEAFIYTSLLYQFKLLMPVGLLKSLITKEWESFKKYVIEAESKGILVQEEVRANASDPDIYFKTKHSLLSKKLIDALISSQDKKFKYYNTLISKLTFGYKNSILIISLLKAIRINNELNSEQIDKLFDVAKNELSEDPHFLLHYSISLQHRGDLKSLEKAIDTLVYANSLLPYTNHKMVHRRGVINFELAKIWFKKESKGLVKTWRYLADAREWFQLKMILDPCSSYSYYDYLSLEIWELGNLVKNESEELIHRIKIEELFDLALKVVFEYKDRIYSLLDEYTGKFKFNNSEAKYLTFIEENYQTAEHRPYALILLLNFYMNSEVAREKWIKYVEEIEEYRENTEVVKFLLKYYGRNLNYIDIRVKYFSLNNLFDSATKESLRYKYFNYVAESYNNNFPYAYEVLKSITKYNQLNVDFEQTWKESNSDEEKIFEGIVISNKRGNYRIKIPSLNWNFPIHNIYEGIKEGEKVEVVLSFFLNGIYADILEPEEE